MSYIMKYLLRLSTGKGPWVEVELSHAEEGRFKLGEVVSRALSNEFEYIFAHLAQMDSLACQHCLHQLEPWSAAMASMLEVAAESMSQTSKCT